MSVRVSAKDPIALVREEVGDGSGPMRSSVVSKRSRPRREKRWRQSEKREEDPEEELVEVEGVGPAGGKVGGAIGEERNQ